jgi:hypothetical protein
MAGILINLLQGNKISLSHRRTSGVWHDGDAFITEAHIVDDEFAATCEQVRLPHRGNPFVALSA